MNDDTWGFGPETRLPLHLKMKDWRFIVLALRTAAEHEDHATNEAFRTECARLDDLIEGAFFDWPGS